MSKSKKSLQDLTLLDRFLFAEVMEDPKTFLYECVKDHSDQTNEEIYKIYSSSNEKSN